MNIIYTKLRHSLYKVHMKLKRIILLYQTWNGVVPAPHKLREHVFYSLSSCLFTLLGYVRHFLNTIVFFGPFWRPLWPSALSSRLVRPMVAPTLCSAAVGEIE